MAGNFDVVIIGAGIIGTCIAYELSKKGFKTLNTDKNPAVGYGSTSSSCAVIRTFYSTTDASALAYEGWHYWRNWQDYVGSDIESPLINYRNCGCLLYKTESNNKLAGVPAIMDAIKCPYEHLTAGQIRQRLPIVDTQRFEPVKKVENEGFAEPTGPEIYGGIFFPVGGYVNDPQLATVNVKEAAVRHGAQFLFNAKIVEISQNKGRVCGVVLGDGTEIKADIVINVAGPHSSKINKMAGIGGKTAIKTRPLKQEVANVAAPQGFDYENDGPMCADDDVGTYSRPESGNHMLIGTVSPACDDNACDDSAWVDADDFDGNISEQIVTQVMRQAQRYSGLQIPSSISGIAALYDVSDDWNPIYDKSDLPGYYMAIGTSGNQFKNAPLVGKIMTAIIQANETGIDHDLQPGKFHLKNVDWTLPLEMFSRNRQINADSSFSVLG